MGSASSVMLLDFAKPFKHDKGRRARERNHLAGNIRNRYHGADAILLKNNLAISNIFGAIMDVVVYY